MAKHTKNSNKKWIVSTKRAHNSASRLHDERVVALVRLLARKAAEQDYEELLKQHSPEKEAKEND